MRRSSRSPGFGSSPGRSGFRSRLGNGVALFLTAWLIYLGDRLADSASLEPDGPQSLRQQFCRRHRKLWIVALAFVAGFDAYMIWRTTALETFLVGAVVGLLALIYLVVNHPLGLIWRSLPAKELAIGILFTAGILVALMPAISSLAKPFRAALAFFAALCALKLHQHRELGAGTGSGAGESFYRHPASEFYSPRRCDLRWSRRDIFGGGDRSGAAGADSRLYQHERAASRLAECVGRHQGRAISKSPTAVCKPPLLGDRSRPAHGARRSGFAHADPADRDGAVSFDSIAPAYRTLETIAFGGALQRARVACLGEIGTPRRALIVGEGNGRFLCELLRRSSERRGRLRGREPAHAGVGAATDRTPIAGGRQSRSFPPSGTSRRGRHQKRPMI